MIDLQETCKDGQPNLAVRGAGKNEETNENKQT